MKKPLVIKRYVIESLTRKQLTKVIKLLPHAEIIKKVRKVENPKPTFFENSKRDFLEIEYSYQGQDFKTTISSMPSSTSGRE